jgi:hypothetical protein
MKWFAFCFISSLFASLLSLKYPPLTWQWIAWLLAVGLAIAILTDHREYEKPPTA